MGERRKQEEEGRHRGSVDQRANFETERVTDAAQVGYVWIEPAAHRHCACVKDTDVEVTNTTGQSHDQAGKMNDRGQPQETDYARAFQDIYQTLSGQQSSLGIGNRDGSCFDLSSSLGHNSR
jgi:hypothetical protein